jgi:tRNA pseudouridine38-40 synthase
LSRIALQLSYDGSFLQGWQTQPHRQTLQDVLEKSLSLFCPESLKIQTTCAGRTDAGVHALYQIVHFDTLERRKDWARGINTFLPHYFSAVAFSEVSDSFHARFSAISRSYTYLILNTPNRVATFDRRCTWVFRPLDIALMQEGAQFLLGEQDFSSFRSVQCQARTPVKTIFDCRVIREKQWVVVRIKANAFLHHMVRNIVSALVEVGSLNRPPEWIRTVIEKKNREFAPATFPPNGLYLSEVEYPHTFGLTFPSFSFPLFI